MRRIDEIHLAHPFYGSRKIRDELRSKGHDVGRDQVRRLMRRMGIEALYLKPRLSRRILGMWAQGLSVSAAGLEINRANQVWCADITYIPHGAGFCIWWRSWTGRVAKVLSWRLSNTLDSALLRGGLGGGALEARPAGDLQHRPGQPVHRGGVHRRLCATDIAISMDGKGRWMDNVFIERLWRSVKYEDVYLRAYEEVYLRAYESIPEARRHIGAYLELYNRRRPHQGLDNRTPDEVFYDWQRLPLAA